MPGSTARPPLPLPRGDDPTPLSLAPLDGTPPTPEDLIQATARGDEGAFETLYDAVAGRVLGLARRIVRDPSQAEEVAQEVFVEVWRQASRFDASRGSALSWILMLTHRRSVDRVRSAQASTNREERSAAQSVEREVDTVAETVEANLEAKAVRRCLDGLTDLQREAINLAYYAGYSYREVGTLLSVPLPTIKTRMRDGLIRLRDCMGVEA